MRNRITKEERKRVQLAVAGLEPIGDVIRSIFSEPHAGTLAATARAMAGPDPSPEEGEFWDRWKDDEKERKLAEQDEIESEARIEKQLSDLNPDDEDF